MLLSPFCNLYLETVGGGRGILCLINLHIFSYFFIQDRLNPAVQSQICGELRLKSYPDLCESLDKLDIAISFLKSVGSDPESSLHYFMTSTLKMNNPLPSQKVWLKCNEICIKRSPLGQ